MQSHHSRSTLIKEIKICYRYGSPKDLHSLILSGRFTYEMFEKYIHIAFFYKRLDLIYEIIHFRKRMEINSMSCRAGKDRFFPNIWIDLNVLREQLFMCYKIHERYPRGRYEPLYSELINHHNRYKLKVYRALEQIRFRG